MGELPFIDFYGLKGQITYLLALLNNQALNLKIEATLENKILIDKNQTEATNLGHGAINYIEKLIENPPPKPERPMGSRLRDENPIGESPAIAPGGNGGDKIPGPPSPSESSFGFSSTPKREMKPDISQPNELWTDNFVQKIRDEFLKLLLENPRITSPTPHEEGGNGAASGGEQSPPKIGADDLSRG